MPIKFTGGALGDYVIPPWGERETWDEWLERIFEVPMQHWKTIHWKSAVTVLGMTLEDLKSERRSTDFLNAEATILKIAADSMQSSSSLIKKLEHQVHTLIQGKNKQDGNLAIGRAKGAKRVKDRAASQKQIIEREIGGLLRNTETALRGNDWIANYIFDHQKQLGINPPYRRSTILTMTKKIAAKFRKELRG